jgi:hypothetical protein
MKNDVFWDVTPCGEPHGITSQKTPFFMNIVVLCLAFLLRGVD